jgi:hypothetical protein
MLFQKDSETKKINIEDLLGSLGGLFLPGLHLFFPPNQQYLKRELTIYKSYKIQ